ncbi:hypothetical protein H0H87_007626 [Tephrocybe sp. NHM501043]|nr:hypothetical protein H0H87_007626 [Tephrocybe sp. NHM501043]
MHKVPAPPRFPVKNPEGNNVSSSSKLQTKYMLPPVPIVRVGNLVCVVGKVTQKFDKREILVDNIAQCGSWNDEPRHWMEVHRLHKENYSLSTPFQIPARPSGPAKPAASTPVKFCHDSARSVAIMNMPPGTSTSTGTRHVVSNTPSTTQIPPSTTHSMTPSSSSQASSPAKATAAQRLCHPSRLHSRDLNSNTFRIYVKDYMDRTAHINTNPESEGESDASSVDEYAGSPSKRLLDHATDATPRPHIPPLSCERQTRPRSSADTTTTDHPAMKGFTLSYLRRVPELADMAQRVVKAVTKRRLREEQQKVEEAAAAVSSSIHRKCSTMIPSNAPRTQYEGKDGRRMKRLFQATIVQLLREGSIVLWDGPAHLCATDGGGPKEEMGQANVSALSTSTRESMAAREDQEELVLSEPEGNEESYVPVSPGFLAEVVEQAIGKLTRGPVEAKGKAPARYGAVTKEGLLVHLRKDDRWRYLSEWNIEEALDMLKMEQRAWCVGRGLWELSV